MVERTLIRIELCICRARKQDYCSKLCELHVDDCETRQDQLTDRTMILLYLRADLEFGTFLLFNHGHFYNMLSNLAAALCRFWKVNSSRPRFELQSGEERCAEQYSTVPAAAGTLFMSARQLADKNLRLRKPRRDACLFCVEPPRL
jgi:hypothetical protein